MGRFISRIVSRGALLGGAGLALALFAGPLTAQAATDSDDTSRIITVSGQGEVRAAPDEAVLSAGVVSSARTAAAALAANSRAMNAVFATLRNAGIAEKSMQTSGFSVSPQYVTDKNGAQTPHISGYDVSNTVTVTVDDLSKVGPTLDALVASGANSIGDIAFTIKNPKQAMAQARADAVADAIARAQTLAKAAGVTLGPITAISENSGYEPPRPMYRMAAMAVGAAAPTPIAAGEQSVTAGVSITWAIH
ncbi:MAG TPA: SIMPL domain-containing protein [Rhizomicrobium sp.]